VRHIVPGIDYQSSLCLLMKRLDRSMHVHRMHRVRTCCLIANTSSAANFIEQSSSCSHVRMAQCKRHYVITLPIPEPPPWVCMCLSGVSVQATVALPWGETAHRFNAGRHSVPAAGRMTELVTSALPALLETFAKG